MRLCLLLGCVAVLASAQTDFRQTAWGMTPPQVMATESAKPSEVQATLVRYDSVKVGDLEARLFYIFADGKLVRASYAFSAQHADPNDLIADFHAVHSKLVAQ